VGSHIIQHTRTAVSELLAQSPHHLRRHDIISYTSTKRLWMLAGHALFRCPVFNTALRRHRLRDEGHTSHKKRGRLPVDTEHSDIPPVLRSPRK
jgi:hypothetical protein